MMELIEENKNGKKTRFIFNNSILVLAIIYYLNNIYSIYRFLFLISVPISTYISNKIIITNEKFNISIN